MDDSQVTWILDLANTRHGPAANLDERLLTADEHDHLSDPAAALAYLAGRRTPVPAEPPTSEQLASLRELRDAARSVVDGPPAALTDRLGRMADASTYRFAPDGTLVPTATGWDALAATALVGLFELVAARGRLGTCANPDCGWLFIDESRNHSRVWCDMSSCGSRAKMTRYRRRRSEPAPA